MISDGFKRFCCLSERLTQPCRSASSVSFSSNRPLGSYTARLLMEIAIGWAQAAKKVSEAVARARPVENAALLVLLGDVKSLPLWKFSRVSGSIAHSKLEVGSRKPVVIVR